MTKDNNDLFWVEKFKFLKNCFYDTFQAVYVEIHAKKEAVRRFLMFINLYLMNI